jgi:hypothetical protein
MKKSSEYLVGESVVVNSRTITKKSDEQSLNEFSAPTLAIAEIWSDDSGGEYAPTLRFSMGLEEPNFNRLMIG